MICCGHELVATNAKVEVKYKSLSRSVDIEGFVCPECGEKYVVGKQAEPIEQAMLEMRRELGELPDC